MMRCEFKVTTKERLNGLGTPVYVRVRLCHAEATLHYHIDALVLGDDPRYEGLELHRCADHPAIGAQWVQD